jgi:acetyltransferase-like isoleucine patch superfamily enzyme
VRKAFLRFCAKLDRRFCQLYTWLLRSSFKSCGEDVQIQFPVRVDQPQAVSIGSGTFIYPGAWINAVSHWAGVNYSGQVLIGNRVAISYGVQISAAQSIVIEDDVALSAGVVIVDHTHDHRHLDVPVFQAPLSKPAPVRVGRGSFLGVHCFIGPGVQIGEHAVVAANAVVLNDVPAYALALGNPARCARFHDPGPADPSPVIGSARTNEMNGVRRA